MVRHLRKTWFLALAVACVAVAGATSLSASAASNPAVAQGHATAPAAHWCNTNGVTCAEPLQNWEDFPFYDRLRSQGVHIGEYIGHDEPLMEFYSHTAGSGNRNTYSLILPKDPPVKPRQSGAGGTWNFQLRPAFWFGMDVCDDQSAPNPAYRHSPYPTTHCQPDSDANIFNSDRASSSHYIGKAPGGAFLELQFYPPGWVDWPAGNSCDARRWCAALNIDSFSVNENTNVPNNSACLGSAGIEPVNFAYLTHDGVATAPAGPLDGDRFNLSPSRDFFMHSGDHLKVRIFDTSRGLTTVVRDRTTHMTGRMVASTANGFASVRFAPGASRCKLIPHPFHPMFSTSTPKTRLQWTAHLANVSVSDEIGHFELCNKVDLTSPILACADSGGRDSGAGDVQDDNYCLPIPGVPSSRINITGCLGFLGDSDIDFDGISYSAHNWPGTIAHRHRAHRLTPTPLRFSSPTTNGVNFTRAAFETDLPRIEDFRPDAPFGGVTVNCQRFIANPSDPHPGAHCVNPPPQSQDYPFFVAASSGAHCMWTELGGLHWPGIIKTFGGNSAKEFGPLLVSHDPTSPAGSVTLRYNNFHRTLGTNPCPA
jgi:hypothetical protein